MDFCGKDPESSARKDHKCENSIVGTVARLGKAPKFLLANQIDDVRVKIFRWLTIGESLDLLELQTVAGRGNMRFPKNLPILFGRVSMSRCNHRKPSWVHFHSAAWPCPLPLNDQDEGGNQTQPSLVSKCLSPSTQKRC